MYKIIDRRTNKTYLRDNPVVSQTETEVFQPNINEYPWMFEAPVSYRFEDGKKWVYSKVKPQLYTAKEGIADCMAWAGASQEEIDEFMNKPNYNGYMDLPELKGIE